jgi:hypothetical protein
LERLCLGTGIKFVAGQGFERHVAVENILVGGFGECRH